MGLSNTLVYAKAEYDLGRRDPLLEELHRLAARYPDDEFLREVRRRAADVTTGKD
jgi:hypothetical protein